MQSELKNMNASEKLQREIEILASEKRSEAQVKLVVSQYKKIVEWLKSECEKNPVLNAQVLQPHKELPEMYKFITDKAKDFILTGQVACVDDDTVFAWVKEYYEIDDYAEVMEKKKKAEEAKIKAAEAKSKAKAKTTKKKTSTAKKKAEGPKEEVLSDKAESATKVEMPTETTPKVEETIVEGPKLAEPDKHLKENVETPDFSSDEDGQFDLFSLL